MSNVRDNSKGILLETGTNEVEFLLFQIGSQRYGINVSKVCQIVLFDPKKISPLPKQHPEVLGLMTFRDRSISIVDLRIHFNIASREKEIHTDLVLVTEFNQRITGFVIDSVDRIERCSWEHFEPITKAVCDKSHGGVVGTVTLKEGIVIILDLETILTKIDPTMSIEHFKDQIAPGNVDRSKLSIVYCEDSVLVQKMLVKSLEDAGFRCPRTFATGAEALAYLEANPASKVDVILSDIEMPKMDGLTLCKKVKALEGYDKVPFVFFSSIINEQMQVKCRSVGADAYFSKPEINFMVNALEELVSRPRESDQK